MSSHASAAGLPDRPLPAPAAPAPVQPAFAHAARLLADMQRHGVAPDPRNYELWFNYRGGLDPALASRVDALLHDDVALSPGLLSGLYDEFVAAPEPDMEQVTVGVDAIQQAAQAIVEQVLSNRAAASDYGDTLAHWANRLHEEPTVRGLLQAVATLTTETSKAAERNRVLEERLSASAARIGKLRQTLADAKQEATTDALTGIANRKSFEIRLKRALARAKTEPAPMSVLLIDIDHFKRFNDTYGHKTGDLVLRLVGRVLADNVKGRDTAARYGGEEFAVLLAGADLTAAAVVARQISEALSSKRLVSRAGVNKLEQVSVSVGVSQFRPGDTAVTLVERADQALYDAKRTGRNKVCTQPAAATLAA